MFSVAQFAQANPLAFHIIIIAASLVVLLKAADLLVFGITNYAKKLGLSDYLVGLLIVSIGASTPEFVSSAMGTIASEPGIVLGTILGSNLYGLTLVLGLLAIIGKKVSLKCAVLEKIEHLIFILGIVPLLFILNGRLSRIEGVVLVGLFVGYVVFLWSKEGKLGKLKKQVKLKNIYKDALVAIGCLVALILSARWLVFSSIKVAHLFSIPTYLIALTVIAIASQVPDLAIGLRAIFRGHTDVAFGDILGSLIAKALLLLGILAIIKPITISPGILLPSIIFTAGALGLTTVLARKHAITYKHGIALLLVFAAFMIFEILKSI